MLSDNEIASLLLDMRIHQIRELHVSGELGLDPGSEIAIRDVPDGLLVSGFICAAGKYMPRTLFFSVEMTNEARRWLREA